MPDQEESFIWEQGPDGLTVRFPTTPAETGHMGCAVAMLVAGLLIMVPLAAAATWGLVSDSTSPQNWVAAAVGSAVAVCLLWYLATGVRKARVAPPPAISSVLTVRDNTLKIERAGRDRDTDVSWDVAEIADIRLCPKPKLPVFALLGSLPLALLFPPDDDLVRISVMLPSGEVEDVLLRAPGKYWTITLEGKLRGYLRLSASPPRNSRGMPENGYENTLP